MAGLTQFASRGVVRLYVDEVGPAHGTGFLYRHNSRVHLVTNWHVMTGRSPSQPRMSAGRIPSRLIYAGLVDWPEDGSPVLFKSMAVDTPDPTQDICPWLEHPARARGIDIAAYSLPESDNLLWCINDRMPTPALGASPVLLHLGLECFLAGYPLPTLGDPQDSPIWVKATIASPPWNDFGHLPLLLVDSASYEGMSGAPLLVFDTTLSPRIDNHVPQQPSLTVLGVYSGRQMLNGPTNLGRVWKMSAVIETIERGVHPSPTAID